MKESNLSRQCEPEIIVQCAQAPQFVDFNNLGGGAAPEEEDRADEFFNVDMESGERYN